MNQNPKVSIVTICLNDKSHLEHSIQSVLNQTYKNIEYIVIDGGSTDGSVDLIKKYEKQIHFWVSEKDRGISSAFNKGIEKCTGEIIGLINSDDWYQSEAAELAVEVFKKNPDADVIYGNLQNWENDQKEMFILSGEDISKINYEMVFNHPSCFVKKSAYEKIGLFDENYHYAMDYELMLRFYKNKAKFIYMNEWVANMRLGGKSEQHWLHVYREMLRSHLQYHHSLFLPYLNYLYKIFRTGMRIFLKKIGLNSIVVFYRSFQKTKKYF